MYKPWDDSLKRLFLAATPDLISWLLPGAQSIRAIESELKVPTRTLQADILYEVRYRNKKCMLHVEIQRNADSNMAYRMWEYNTLIWQRHKCKVYSFVIYLQPISDIPEPVVYIGEARADNTGDSEWIHAFRFSSILLAQTQLETLQATGLKGLLPLWILTRNGATQSVAEEVFRQVGDKPELLTIALTIASLVFRRDADKEWLKKEVTVLEDLIDEETNVFIQHYISKGNKKGREEGILEGELLTQRRNILRLVQKRFPELVQWIQERVEAIKSPDALQDVLDSVIVAQNVEDVRQAVEGRSSS